MFGLRYEARRKNALSRPWFFTKDQKASRLQLNSSNRFELMAQIDPDLHKHVLMTSNANHQHESLTTVGTAFYAQNVMENGYPWNKIYQDIISH